MWEERTSWHVSWSGITIWGDDYSDSALFDDRQSAMEFCAKLRLKDGVDYIDLKESIIWRKKE